MRKTGVIYTYAGAGQSLSLKVIWKFTLNVKKKASSMQLSDAKIKVEGEGRLGELFKQCSLNCRLTQRTNTYTFIQSRR